MNNEYRNLEGERSEIRSASKNLGKEAVDDSESWEKYHQLGDFLQEKGQYEEAAAAYHRAIELNNNFFWSYQQLGDTLSKLQQWQETVGVYRHAIELESNFPWSYNNLGYALLKLEQWEEAITCYRRAIELNINFSWSYYNLGVCFGQKQQWDEAAIAYLHAVFIDAELPEIYKKLGESIQQWRVAAGTALAIPCESTLGILPSHSDCYLQLGNALAKHNQLEGAIAVYEKAQKLNPEDSEIIRKLEEVFRKKHELEEAITSCRQAVDKNPDFCWSYYHLGVALSRYQQWDEAVAAYLRVLELNPDFHWWFYYNIWEAFTKQGKLEQAANLSRLAIEKNPDAFWPYLNLGEALTRQGKINEAITCYQTASYKQILVSHPAELRHKPVKINPIHKPDFIIIGSQRCGTTSLYSYLIKHPQILSPIKKEVDFWSWHFQRGINWYLAHFPPLPEGHYFLTGEASPSYFDHREAGERLFNAFPEMKAIVLLRNPTDRAISQYHRWVSLNWEHRSFEEAIDEEIKRLAKQPENIIREEPGNYIARGLYINFIKKWLALFPREQLLILRSEDFYGNTAVTVKQVLKFIGLSEHQLSEYKNANPGSYESLNESLRQKLNDYFRPYNQELEEYLGMNFNWE